MPEKILNKVPYHSQLTNPFTDKYFASTVESNKNDRSPDGCWMNPHEGNPSGYGKESLGCISPEDRYCIRPGSCNITSLYMLLSYFGINQKIPHFPDGSAISNWLAMNEFSPAWIYYYMMEFWGEGQQRYRIHPEFNYKIGENSAITADPFHMRELIELLGGQNPGIIEEVIVKAGELTFSDFKQAIDAGSPVVMDSGRAGHVVAGIGYRDDNIESAVVHDPYGRINPNWLRGQNEKKWDKYNGCGEEKDNPTGFGNYGQSVEYPFAGLQPINYLLFCRPAEGFNIEFGGQLLNPIPDVVAGIERSDPRAEANRIEIARRRRGETIELPILEHRMIPSEFILDSERKVQIEFVAKKTIPDGKWQIVDAQDNPIRTILEETISEGKHTYEWNGYTTDDENKVPAGKYRSRVSIDEGQEFYSPYCLVK